MAVEEEEDGKVEILGSEKGKKGKGVLKKKKKKKKGRERRLRREMKKRRRV